VWHVRGKSYVSFAFAHVQPGLSDKTPFDCGGDDLGDAAFVRATKFIGGRNAMEEFVARGMHLLACNMWRRVLLHHQLPLANKNPSGGP
jgi:hypothetical protein